jgi:hypothetical protein
MIVFTVITLEFGICSYDQERGDPAKVSALRIADRTRIPVKNDFLAKVIICRVRNVELPY